MFDTLSDVPADLKLRLTVPLLRELVVRKLHDFTGIVVQGQSSRLVFDAAAVVGQTPPVSEWGDELLVGEDSIEMRAYPKGLISKSDEGPVEAHFVMLATRRRNAGSSTCKITFAILWRRMPHVSADVKSLWLAGGRQVGATNLNILLPSLFRNHSVAPPSSRPWKSPVSDALNFHSIVPSATCIVDDTVSNDDVIHIKQITSGHTQFLLTADLMNLTVPDPPHRTITFKTTTEHYAECESYQRRFENAAGAGRDALESATFASAILDMLTCEGLLGMMSESFLDGALPDCLHFPNGLPIVLAFAVRLCFNPAPFGLPMPTPEDAAANAEIATRFNAAWEPLAQTHSGSPQYVIDLVVRAAVKDARMQADDGYAVQHIKDSILYWQAAGQRCATAIFGLSRDDVVRPTCPLGMSDLVNDPLAAARRSVLIRRIGREDEVDCKQPRSFGHQPSSLRRERLLNVLNSVEGWLRTGRYEGVTLTRKEPLDNFGFKMDGETGQLTKRELRARLEEGMQRSLEEVEETGGADVNVAREAAAAFKTQIEDALALHAEDETVSLNAVSGGCADDDDDDPSIDLDRLCVGAFHDAVRKLTSALLSGPAFHHQFGLSAYVASTHSIVECADCAELVHCLDSTLLGTTHAACRSCHRPRCLNCIAAAHKRSVARMTCKRCAKKENKARRHKPTAESKR